MEEGARSALISWVKNVNVRMGGGPVTLPGLPNQALTELSKLDQPTQQAEIEEVLGTTSDEVRSALRTLLTKALAVQAPDPSQYQRKVPKKTKAKSLEPRPLPTTEPL